MKVDCRKASRLISRRLDGAISRREASALERHLDACPSCRAEWEEQERLAQAMASLPEPTAPDGLGERLRRALCEEPESPGGARTGSPGFRMLAFAAVLLLTVSVVLLSLALEKSRRGSAELLSALQAARRQLASEALRRQAPAITPTEAAVVEQLRAFRAVRDYVGAAMRWMVTDGDQVEVGMSGGPAAQSAGPDKETIVLNFECRELACGGPPRVVSNPEFVFFSGDEVSVRLRGRARGGPILRYRVGAQRLIGGGIRAEVQFAREAASDEEASGALTVRTVLTPGKPVLIGAGGDGDRRWELYLWGVARPTGYPGGGKEAKSL